jgi:hypothetical protein
MAKFKVGDKVRVENGYCMDHELSGEVSLLFVNCDTFDCAVTLENGSVKPFGFDELELIAEGGDN